MYTEGSERLKRSGGGLPSGAGGLGGLASPWRPLREAPGKGLGSPEQLGRP